MSVSSLESGNLILNTLTVNNSQYSDVSGYVPSQTVISSTKTSTALISASLNTNQLILTQSGSANDVTASCLSDGVIDVAGTVSSNALACNGNLTLYNATDSTDSVTVNCNVDNTLNLYQNPSSAGNNVGIQCLGSGILNVIGNVSCNTISGNGTLTLYNATDSTDNVVMACVTDNTLSLYASDSTSNAVGLNCYQNTTGNLQVGSLSSPATSTVVVSAIQFLSLGSSGILTINSTGQLTYNGVVIS